MKIFFSILIYLFLVFQPSFAKDSMSGFLSFECQIIDFQGKLLKKFGGGHCIYLDDGSVLSSSQSFLKKISPDEKLLWGKRLNSHHTIRLFGDKNFLLLTSSVHLYEGELLRFDRISLFDFDGNEVNFFDFFDHAKELLERASDLTKPYRGATFPTFQSIQDDMTEAEKLNFKPVYHEFSHANSIYEIPDNKIYKKMKAFKKGNFIVSVNGLGLVFILSGDFKKILWSLPYSGMNVGGGLHDIQIDLSRSKLLFYNNNYKSDSSSIEKFDPITKKKSVIFFGTKDFVFYGESQGSVQELGDGSYLVSQFNKSLGSKVFIVKDKVVTWHLVPTQEGLVGRPLDGLQEVKKLNLESFFKNHL